MITANLIPLPRLDARRRQVRTRHWSWAWAGYAVVLGGLLVAAAMGWQTDRSAPEAELGSVLAEVDKNEKSVKQLRATIDSQRKKLWANLAVGDQPDWSVLLVFVKQTLGEEAWLRRFRLQTLDIAAETDPKDVKVILKPAERRFAMNLIGIAASQNSVSDMVIKLERLGLFERVELRESKRVREGGEENKFASERVAFEIEAWLDTREGANKAPEGRNDGSSAGADSRESGT